MPKGRVRNSCTFGGTCAYLARCEQGGSCQRRCARPAHRVRKRCANGPSRADAPPAPRDRPAPSEEPPAPTEEPPAPTPRAAPGARWHPPRNRCRAYPHRGTSPRRKRVGILMCCRWQKRKRKRGLPFDSPRPCKPSQGIGPLSVAEVARHRPPQGAASYGSGRASESER